MRKDLKTGMLIGLFLIIAVAIWLATHPELTFEATIIQQIQQEPNLPVTINSSESPLPFHKSHEPNESPTQAKTPPPASRLTADITVYEQPKRINTQRFHIVSPGQTLTEISQQYYGTATNWQKIQKANNLTNPHNLTPGTKLIIPD